MEDQRLILRYRFEAKPGVYWTNILKIAKKEDFFQIYINNGNDKMSQFRLHKDQAKELMEFIRDAIGS